MMRVDHRRFPTAARLAVAVSLVVAPAFAAAPAGAHDDGGAKQAVIAFNQADRTKLIRTGVQVTSTGSPTAAPENLAHAQASCTDCRTVAVAVQAVLMAGPSAVVTPRNAAVAVNSNCQGCQTMAAAYQCALTTTGPVPIGAEGQQKIVDLRAQIAAVAASEQAFEDIDAQLDDLVTQLWAVIDAALAAAGEENRCNREEDQEIGEGVVA